MQVITSCHVQDYIPRSPGSHLSYDSVRLFAKKAYSSVLQETVDNLYFLFRLCLEQSPSKTVFRYSNVQNEFSIPELNGRFSFPSSFLGEIEGPLVRLYSFLEDPVPLGLGGYKKINGAVKGVISKENESSNLVRTSVSPCAIAQVEKEDITIVRKGLQMHREILNLPKADQYFVSLPYLEEETELGLEIVDSYYHGSLDSAVLRRSIPQEMRGAGRVFLDTSDFILFAKSLLEGVSLLQENGFFHRDIKLSNILMNVGEDGVIKALIGDFDTVSKQSINGDPAVYFCRNSACQMGYASKETDRFGLILVIGAMLLYEGAEIDQNSYQRILVDPEMERRGLWRKYRGSLTRDSFERVFDLLEIVLRADCEGRSDIIRQISDLEKSLKLPKHSVEKYLNNALSLEEKSVYESVLEEISLKSFENYPLPTVDEIGEVIDRLRVEDVARHRVRKDQSQAGCCDYLFWLLPLTLIYFAIFHLNGLDQE